jgi:hypothetical protein
MSPAAIKGQKPAANYRPAGGINQWPVFIALSL